MKSSPVLLSRSITVRARTDVDETEPCDNNGGSLHITGFIEDNGTGTLTLDYINCREGEETLDGAVTAQINAFDFGFFIPTDAIYNFAILTISSSTINASLSGSIHSQISIGTETEQLTVDKLVARNNATGEMLMIRNHVSVIDYDNIFSPSSFSETITGRIYDSTHGYVDFTTIVAIIFSTITQEYPDGGQLLLTGSLNSGIQVTVISDTHTSLDLDLDGDTSFEIAVTVSWSDLETEPDLADSDDDGIHDNWEQANGLDSSDSTDANNDDDFDGFSNIEEYLAGTNPNDNGSVPPVADLSVTKSYSGERTLGSTGSYIFDVRNNGPSTAKYIVVTDVLPPGVSFISTAGTGGGWNCNHESGTVICTRIDSVGITVPLWINVTLPSIPGIVSNMVTVSSVTLDNNLINNSDTVDTVVVTPSADLSINKTTSSNAVVIGASLTYTLTVRNDGPQEANSVVVTDTLATDLVLDSVIPDQGSCTGVATIVCDLGAIGNTGQAEIEIIVSPTIEGDFDNTATVTSSTQDPNPANNSSTVTTLVGASVSVIQSLIDAAIPGDTIQVNPGNYIGSLDFNGKDITLTANGGPTNTVLHGNNSKAVIIGPGGAIDGFTITGARASFGAGIEVRGSGTLISGNIFDENIQSGGGFGAAIGGNSSSPTIERNIFRNNSCDSQFLSGVISFVNNSSPVIQNNILENNSCRGLNLTLPAGSTPVILNNTFIGNDVGIRIDRRNTLITQVYRNNIIVQNGIGLEVEFGTETENPIWENNLVFGNAIDYEVINDQSWVNGNISSDPLFVDAAAGNYLLQTGSPAIDTGSSVGAPTVDFDGMTRPLDGDGDTVPEFDMGAFEAPAL
jgi:uncharacterized repeat protein (TIGR01451 family)